MPKDRNTGHVNVIRRLTSAGLVTTYNTQGKGVLAHLTCVSLIFTPWRYMTDSE